MGKARGRRRSRPPVEGRRLVVGSADRKTAAFDLSIGERVAGLLGQPAGAAELAWAAEPLPPLPTGEDLVTVAGEAVQEMLPPPRDSVRSLAGCYALGYGMLGLASRGDGTGVPEWLTSADAPIDPLDVLFLGACWPQQLRDPAEFGNARDAWLRILSRTRHGQEVARFIAAGLSASEELNLPIDDGTLLMALALRVAQAAIGREPLSAKLMPATALAGLRAVYGPRPGVTVPDYDGRAAMELQHFVRLMATDLPSDGTIKDEFRVGLSILVAALLLDTTSAERIMAASHYSGMYAEEDDTAQSSAEAITAAVELNHALGSMDRPHEILSASVADIVPLLKKLPGIVLIPSLRVGLADAAGRGDRIRESLPWALGLPPSSPLIRVTDVILVAPPEQSAADLLGRVLTLPETASLIESQDRDFGARTGVAFQRLALAAGASQVHISDGHVVRKLDSTAVASIRAQQRRFEEKFGRPMRADDPLFFDPDADLPRPMAPERIGAVQRELLEQLGTDEVTIRAAEIAEMMPPLTGRFPSRAQQRDWDAAVATAAAEHGFDDEDAASLIAKDITRLAWWTLATHVREAIEDPAHGAALLDTFQEAVAELGQEASGPPSTATETIGALALTKIVATQAANLIPAAKLAHLAGRAHEFARAWARPDLTRSIDDLIATWPAPQRSLKWQDVPAAVCLVAARASEPPHDDT
jgi:hypothetical protein